MNRDHVLFVHKGFPAQFGFIARALLQQGVRCVAIGSDPTSLPGMPTGRWTLKRGADPKLAPVVQRAELDLLRARAAAQCAIGFRDQGFDPAVIVGHPGWGETLMLGEVFPRAKQVVYGEFYYHSTGADVGFDPAVYGEPDDAQRFRVRSMNGGLALAYVEADAIVCPTPFQASLLPPNLRGAVRMIHEGVDVDVARPDPDAVFGLEGGRQLDRTRPVITFVNRNFEPLRGFHVFMRALPRVMAEVPEAEVLPIGGDGKGYGDAPPDRTWREMITAELGDRLDPSRVHVVGRSPYPRLLQALSISAAHVYFTYPFVLSWSLLDAMACECLVIASDTAPVRDLVESGRNGVLVDFFDVDALSAALVRACREPVAFAPLRKAARQTVLEGYDRRRHSLPAWLSPIGEMRSAA